MGDSVEDRADIGTAIGIRAENKMFFAVRDRFGVLETEDAHPRLGHFGSDRFVTEVDTKAVGSGAADHAAEQHGRMLESHFGAMSLLAEVPQGDGAGPDFGVAGGCLEGCGGSAGGDEVWDWQTGIEDACAKRVDGRKGFGELLLELCVGLEMQVSIVGVQTGGRDTIGVAEFPIEFKRGIAGCDSGAVHPHIEIDIEGDTHSIALCFRRDLPQRMWVVDDC